MPKQGPGQRVAVVFHSFAHYRQAALEQLAGSPNHHYVFVAQRDDPYQVGVKPAHLPESAPFVTTPWICLGRRPLWQRGLIRLALRRDLDTIIYHGNANWPSTWLSAMIARLGGKRVLFWTHGWVRRERGRAAWIRCRFYRLAHGLLLYGHGAKMIGLEAGFAAERLHVIYNSLDYDAQRMLRQRVDHERILQIRAQLFDAPRLPMVICTSRLIRTRRLDLLFQSLVQLRQQGHEVRLLLVGDGEERPALERLACDLDLPVNFYGACYDEQVLAELIMAAHLTVSPGPIGLTAVHSLAYGTPVITHDDADDQGPEWEAIVPSVTGDFFTKGQATDLARVIRRWTQSPQPQAAIRAQCHRVIERFYNPRFQRIAIDRAVSGQPADDLFWMKDPKTIGPSVGADRGPSIDPQPKDGGPLPRANGGLGPRDELAGKPTGAADADSKTPAKVGRAGG